jgi:hypothetical protein
MGRINRSGGIYKNKYMVGDWVEFVATVGGTDYPIGCTQEAMLVVTNRIYAHKQSDTLGSIDVLAHVMVGFEVRGKMEEIHRENIRLLLDKLPTGANQVEHGTELYPAQYFTVHGRRPNAMGTETTSVEFCLWKCRAGDLLRLSESEKFSFVRFRFVGLDDSDGDFGGSSEKPYGWIYAGDQEVTPVTCTWTAIPSSIIPSVDNTYDEGSLTHRWRRLFLSQYASLGEIDIGTVVPPNNSVYINTADGKLYFKDGAGVSYDLATSLGPIASPAVYDADTTVNYPAGLTVGTTDSIDIAVPSSGDEFTEGQVVKVTLVDVDGLGGGDVRVRLYNDQARSDCIFDQYFDLAATPLTAVIPAHFLSDGIVGDAALYADITNHTFATADFQLVVRVAGILTGSMSWGGAGTGVGAANARDGIGWDGTGLYADLLTNGGLGLQGVTPNKKLYVVQGNGISVGATVAIDTAVTMALNSAQTNTALKRFSAGTIGFAPHGSTVGPPVAGAWQAGDFFVDVNLLLWRCISTGTPGTWQFFGTSLEENIDSDPAAGTDTATYTAEIACESSLDLDISVSANFGYVQKLCIWASQSTWPTGDINQPFRIACFPNSNREQRDLLWMQPGQWRKVSLAAGMTGGVDNVAQVTDVDLGAEDELVRMRKLAGTDAEEYARIQTRDTSAVAFTLHEAVLNTFAADDPVMFVTEVVMMPFLCNDPLNPFTLFLTVYNDGTVGTDADVVVGYQMNLQYMGGGSNY